ncbi:MAG: hypothetical protein INH41_05300 [Myxococcaceae bacterium]|jgi:hypothetical protein|nr:hypothetical protein [Myxococcaceae bacterium]MCA3011801.1 hypothetical protein [Myxococcaceae bacterium]
MRRLALVLAVVVATHAVAEPPRRSAASGIGVALVGLGVGAAAFGVGQLIAAEDVRRTLAAYAPPNDGPSASEAPGVALLLAQSDRARLQGAIGLAAGAAVLIGGLVALLLDRPAPAAVTLLVAPTPGGGALGLSARF